MSATPGVYGLVAEFHDPGELTVAVKKAREEGYRKIDAYTPFPIEGVFEAMGLHHNVLPLLVLCGGIIGACAGIGLQYWTSVIAYPNNIGGRPLFSIPSFIPVTFECTILFAALTAVVGMLALNGLPMPRSRSATSSNYVESWGGMLGF